MPISVSSPPPPVSADGETAGAREVTEIREVWMVHDEWWRTAIHRRYLDVVLEGGAHVVLFEDLTSHQWYLQTP